MSLGLGRCLLLVAVVAVVAATCCQAKKKEKEEQIDIHQAYKELFVRSKSLSVDEVLVRLKVLTSVYGNPDMDMPLDYHLLISFNATDEFKCDSYDYVRNLKDTYEEVERQYKPLRKYMHDCLSRQLKLCDFENRFRERFEQFKAQAPGQWQLIQEFNKQAEKMGKRSSDWESGVMDNEFQMNEALERLASKTAKRGEDPAKSAYNLAVNLRTACSNFDERLSAGLLMTTIDRKNRKNKEIKEWYRLMSVCRQVGRVSFERSLGDIFGHTYYPEMQNAWEKWQDMTSLW